MGPVSVTVTACPLRRPRLSWPASGGRPGHGRWKPNFRPTHILQCKIPRTNLWCMANPEGRRSQLLRGVLDLCLLAVMAEGPAYGYEMTKRLRARGPVHCRGGSIYPLLGRLERDGLVETRREASNGGPPRKYYSLSPEGEQALETGRRSSGRRLGTPSTAPSIW